MFDLPAYLARIGWSGPARPDLATLRELVRRHAAEIPFENLGPWLGHGVELDPEALQRKMLGARRGGYCFEQNALLAEALRALGFEVSGLLGRVLWRQPEDALNGRSHMLLRVELEEGTHLVDVGFGGLTLTGVLRLEEGVEQATPHEPFRLLLVDGDWRVQAMVQDEWRSLYRFDLQRQHPVDYAFANYYLSTAPASRFVKNLIAARAEPGRRLALLNRELAVHPLGGDTERSTLAPAEVLDALRDLFGLDVPEPERVLARLEQDG